MITTTQASASQNATHTHRLGAPAQLAERIQPGMRAFHHPPAAHLDRRRHPTRGDLAGQTTASKLLVARLVVVAGVQVHGRPLGQRTNRVQGIERDGQQAVVAAVGRRGDDAKRDAVALHHQGSLATALAAVDRAWAGNLAAARRLGDAAVHDQVVKLQADEAVIGGYSQPVELVGHAGGDPLITAVAQGAF